MEEELATNYDKQRYPEVNTKSIYIVQARIAYSTMLVLQMVVDPAMGFRRVATFIFATFLHYVYIILCQRITYFQKYHSSVITLTFASFCLNSPS